MLYHAYACLSTIFHISKFPPNRLPCMGALPPSQANGMRTRSG